MKSQTPEKTAQMEVPLHRDAIQSAHRSRSDYMFKVWLDINLLSNNNLSSSILPHLWPKTWNGLPVDLRHLPNGACSQFHHLLKTVLFRLAWVGSASE